MTFHLDLTAYENEELKLLSKKLFGDTSFKVFSDAEKNTLDYKRYDELMSRKLKYLEEVV